MKKLGSNKENEFNESSYEYEERYLRAKKKVDKLKGFYWHLAVYFVINVFLVSMNAMSLEEGETMFHFGTFSTAFFWGIGLFFHWLGIFGPDLMLGRNWEEKKIKELVDNEQRSWE